MIDVDSINLCRVPCEIDYGTVDAWTFYDDDRCVGDIHQIAGDLPYRVTLHQHLLR